MLGGPTWAKDEKRVDDFVEDLDHEIFRNQFSSLNLEEPADQTEDKVEAADEESAAVEEYGKSAGSHTAKPRNKKGAKGKKGKTKAKPPPSLALLDIPFESYRIIEGEEGTRTEYLMAVQSVVVEWIDLRQYVQSLWRDVAFGKLNSAVGGTLSNIAISMVKQTEAAVFVDFPGHESYKVIMNTITRGNVDKAQGMFSVSLSKVGPSGQFEPAIGGDIDVKEQFFIHTYNTLVDFVKDFQTDRKGVPTKAMLSTIYQTWDPKLDLQTASPKQRLKWRRTYANNWLYDLVNLFSSIVVQRINCKGQKFLLETIDLTIRGPWNKHRRLYGLNEFAGDITALAMQKPGGDFEIRIRPHHIFQLQCIIDSMTVSRGWSINAIRGHVLGPLASEFKPRRDVDLFLDRQNETIRGFCASVDILCELLKQDAKLYGDPDRAVGESEILQGIKDDFVNFLGESKYSHGLDTIPPSRFSPTDSNGLQEYSPFLCGVGLMEELELAYSTGMLLWDKIPEPMCIMHLYNMAIELGYIKIEIGLYGTLSSLFAENFFPDGKRPKKDFVGAFTSVSTLIMYCSVSFRFVSFTTLFTVADISTQVCTPPNSRRATFERKALKRNIFQTATDVHGVLNASTNHFFKQKSILNLYREADWIPERVPEQDIPAVSALASMRIAQAKVTRDPETGKETLERTHLVKRMEAAGMDMEKLVYIGRKLSSLGKQEESAITPEMLAAAKASAPPGYEVAIGSSPTKTDGLGGGILDNRGLFNVLKMDIMGDVNGHRPLSSCNYLLMTITMIAVFAQIEEALKKRRNRLWVRAYEDDEAMRKEKRLSLTMLIHGEKDEECLEVVGEAFEKMRAEFGDFVYWGELDVRGAEGTMGSDLEVEKRDEEDFQACCVM